MLKHILAGRPFRFLPVLLVMLTVVVLPVRADDIQVVVSPSNAVGEAGPQLQQRQPPVIQLTLDDNSSESSLGLVTSTGAAKQFLWFNRFTPGAFPIDLEQIWVLFPPGANMSVGSPVQLVVYQDADGNPANGAVLTATYDVSIQVVDGATFSVYDLVPPLHLEGGDSEDLLIGVISRFVTSGVTSTTQPAAIDTSSSQGRSWLAVWSGDPPDPPALPSNDLYGLVDGFQLGNWMIRAVGTGQQVQPQAPAIPLLGVAGLALLAALLLLFGTLAIRR